MRVTELKVDNERPLNENHRTLCENHRTLGRESQNSMCE